MSTKAPLYRPPAPIPAGHARTVLRILFGRGRNLLAALPASSYRVEMGMRSIHGSRLFLLNDPGLVRQVLIDEPDLFPKADIFVDALSPLVGSGIFVSNGELWHRQRAMIRPAFSPMALRRSFPTMREAVATCLARFDQAADSGEALALDAEMSHVTADIIFRTIFSKPLDEGEAADVFAAFAEYQRLSEQLSPMRLFYGLGWSRRNRPDAITRVCARIRGLLGRMIDERAAAAASGRPRTSDIAGEIMAARDPETGRGMSRDELIDQIAVFFLAGHETTASALTWALFVLSRQPRALDRIRREVAGRGGAAALGADDLQAHMPFTRDVLREILRLYPPVSFLVRSPLREVQIRRWTVRPGEVIVVSPWIIHRHRRFWSDPELFDPDRFSAERRDDLVKDAYLPFGLGARACTGSAFASLESMLILARLCEGYDLSVIRPDRVRPAARLTVRTEAPVRAYVRRR